MASGVAPGLEASLHHRSAAARRWVSASIDRSILLRDLIPALDYPLGEWDVEATRLLPAEFDEPVELIAVVQGRAGALIWLELTDDLLAVGGLPAPVRPGLARAWCLGWADPLLQGLRHWLGDETLHLDFTSSRALGNRRPTDLAVKMRSRTNYDAVLLASLSEALAVRLAACSDAWFAPEWSPPLRLMLSQRLCLPVRELRRLGVGDVLMASSPATASTASTALTAGAHVPAWQLCAERHDLPMALMPLATVDPDSGHVLQLAAQAMAAQASAATPGPAMVWADLVWADLGLGARECRALAAGEPIPDWHALQWRPRPALRVGGVAWATLEPSAPGLGLTVRAIGRARQAAQV